MTNEGIRLIEEMLQASPDALVVMDSDGFIEVVTAAAEGLFGYEPGDLIGEPVEILLPVSLAAGHVIRRDGFLESPVVRPMGAGLDLRARRKDGTEFPVDVSLVPTSQGGSLRVGAFVRDATRRRRDEDTLRFVNEISRIVLEGADTEDSLAMVATQARRLVGGEVAWVVVKSAASDVVVVAAADGRGAEELVGANIPIDTSLAARAMVDGGTLPVEDMSGEPNVLVEARRLGLGPGVYLPMMAQDGPIGTLVLARTAGAASFSTDETAAAEVFASAAAIVVALGNARRDLEESRVSHEHERIARDLHDTVIQRLFALGMRLQSSERLAQGPVAERIRDAVDAIDEIIREIRETIFDLGRSDTEAAHLRQKVRQVAEEASGHLGFAPRIAFRGPVEAAVRDDLADHLISVLREALANVSRHAKASAVDIVLIAADGDVTLNVSDDGVGIETGPTAGHGTANMAARAVQLGGEMRLTRRNPSGTLLLWRVPRPG